jgi:hypothetical protein
MFQVNLLNLLRNKNAFFERYGMCNEDINKMEYWKFEEHIKLLNETLKREKEEHDKQQKEHSKHGNFNPSSIMNKMPKYNK